LDFGAREHVLGANSSLEVLSFYHFPHIFRNVAVMVSLVEEAVEALLR
jgi:hypothetical protein